MTASTAGTATQPSVDVSESVASTARDGYELVKAMLELQPRLFALVADGAEIETALSTIVAGVRDALSARACVVAIQHGDQGTAMSSEVTASETIIEAVRAMEGGEPDALPPALKSLGFASAWIERVEELGAARAQEIARVVVLFTDVRPCGPLERLALQSLAPVLRATAAMLTQDRELESARERFASLESSIPGVVYQRVLTPDGDLRYTYISENAVDLFGVTAERIVNDPKALFSNYSQSYRDSFRERLIEASAELRTWDVEAEIELPDGTTKYTHAIATPRRQPDGSTVWTGVILDASRIKEAERKAAEVEARTRTLIVESLGQAFLLFDAEDRLQLKNSAFDELFPSLTPKVTVGTRYADYVSFDHEAARDPEESIAASRRLGAHEKGEPSITERQLADGTCLLVDEHRTEDGNTVVLYTDITELRQREARIQHMAHHDALTGLPNRVLFNDRLTQALSRAGRRDSTVGVLCLDLDHFKNVNDTLGHPAGDALLREVSRRIEAEIRACDTVSRLGGDEFAVVMTDMDGPEACYRAGERIIESLMDPVDLGNDQQALTGGSVGIAYSRGGGETAETLLKRADLALYRAKEDGRGVVRIFEPEMDAAARERRALEMDLRFALERDELDLYFQPLINTKTSHITGFEALVRWNHPERGFINPDEFVPLAEETGLIARLSDWVLDRACEEAASWPKPVMVAVNLSPAQFKQRDLVDKVKQVLDRTGLDPRRLELEITESLLIKRAEVVHKMLYELKEIGVRIAMDDFGTGYSSLGNLRSFPFDKLKIDKSFVTGLENNEEALAIVRAVVGLGKSMGLETVAEGVETLDQLIYLRIEGCNQVQGYYYSRAENGDAARALLETDNPWGLLKEA